MPQPYPDARERLARGSFQSHLRFGRSRMKLRMAVGVCVVMMLVAVVWVRAAETGEKKPMSSRLTQPWSKISSLSDDQKTKIRELHAKAVADKKAIDDKE